MPRHSGNKCTANGVRPDRYPYTYTLASFLHRPSVLRGGERERYTPVRLYGGDIHFHEFSTRRETDRELPNRFCLSIFPSKGWQFLSSHFSIDWVGKKNFIPSLFLFALPSTEVCFRLTRFVVSSKSFSRNCKLELIQIAHSEFNSNRESPVSLKTHTPNTGRTEWNG